MSKKPVPLYPPEFVAKDIQVGDWVYAAAFSVFARVTYIVPRVAERGSGRVYEREDVEKHDPKLRRFVTHSPLVVLSEGDRVDFGNHETRYLCSNHLVKVTPELLSRFVGERTLKLTQALARIKL
jgi:hypothetical protein